MFSVKSVPGASTMGSAVWVPNWKSGVVEDSAAPDASAGLTRPAATVRIAATSVRDGIASGPVGLLATVVPFTIFFIVSFFEPICQISASF